MSKSYPNCFKQFVDELPEERRKKTALILKTAPVDNNGTNLLSVYEDLVPEVNIIILPEILNTENMNYLYNMADVTVAPSSAEGFGLSVAESVLSGTPIIASCIGGLQDQMRFVDDSGDCISIDVNHPTNSDKRYNIHGE